MTATLDMRERDVGPLREDRMIFQERPEARQIIGIDIIDPEDRMRIAHAHGRRRMQDRRVDRPDLQFNVAGVAKLFGKRNVLPSKLWRAHIDGVKLRRRTLPAVQQACRGFEGDRGLSSLLEQAAHHATHAVAAGVGFRTVIVEDPDERLGAGKARRLQHHQLVVGHLACHRARVGRRHRAGPVAQVHHDDLVADAVHLRVSVVGERAHENIQFTPALYGERSRLDQSANQMTELSWDEKASCMLA